MSVKDNLHDMADSQLQSYESRGLLS